MFKKLLLSLALLTSIIAPTSVAQIAAGINSTANNQALTGPAVAQFNDPKNLSGLGAGAIHDGIVNVALCAGVTVGSGQTLGTRQATFTGIQNAITYAETNGLVTWLPSGIYEVDSSSSTGLQMGFTASSYVLGSGRDNTRIMQYHTNVPVATVGPTTALYYEVVKGLSFEYGVSQTGNTSANTLVIGALVESIMEDINVGNPNTTFAGYRGIFQNASIGEFSNTFRNFQVQGGQLNLVGWTATGSGSLWYDWYMRAGALNAPAALSGYAWDFITGGGPGTMIRMNVEGVTVNSVFHTETCRNLLMEDIHLETVDLTGANPSIFFTSFSTIDIQNFWWDGRLTTADSASGTGRFITSFGGDEISIKRLHIMSLASDSGAANLNFKIFDNTNSTPDTPGNYHLQDLVVDDFNSGGIGSRVFIADALPIANFASPKSLTEYVYQGVLSERKGAVLNISTTYTVYGGERQPDIVVPFSITSFNLTLADVWYSGSTAPPPTGSTIHVRRATGTVSGTLTVKDGAGGTLTTNSTSNADFYYSFNGTAWVAVT